MLTQVGQDELADIPRMGPVRERLLGKALAFYQGFLHENGNDPSIRKELARSYGRIGEIHAMLHHQSEAEAAFREAITVSSRTPARTPDSEGRADLARFHGGLGSLLIEAGRSSEAALALDRSTEFLESLNTEFPDNPAYEHELARLQFTRGRLLLGLHDMAGSMRCYAQSVTLGEALVARQPEIADYRFDLARSLASLGLFGSSRTEYDPIFQKSIGLLETLSRENPDVARYAHQLGRVLINRGARLQGDGALDDARRCFMRLISIYERLVVDFPDRPDYRHHLAMGHNNLGELLASTGDAAGAERAFRASLALKKALADANPDVPDYMNALGTGLASLGQCLADHDRLSEGRALLEQAITAHHAALAKVPSDAVFRGEARQSSLFLGKILNRLGDHAALAALAAHLSPSPAGFSQDDCLAASLLARSMPLALADAALTPARRHSLAAQYSESAMTALREAIRKGDRDLRHFQSDLDLVPLRTRDDFGLLMMDLAIPANPFAR